MPCSVALHCAILQCCTQLTGLPWLHCPENKCNEVIFFLAWLVANDYFDEAGFFCMLKGHTYTGLDQSFNTMIMHLKQFAIYCVSSLLHHVWQSLREYDCLRVIELHAYWDWKDYFTPHINTRMGGFATGQFGSGMHDFYLRKDGDGIVRIWFRKSSQASGWEPEGPGLQVFTTVPTGDVRSAPYRLTLPHQPNPTPP